MEALYDTIGKTYSVGRKEDPSIAATISGYLTGAKRVLNIGAGTGAYEPRGTNLVAVEPSRAMIEQRPVNAAPVKQAFAEALPFKDGAFSHSMTVLSMHHWEDRKAAFSEIKRVTTQRFVAFTWDPASSPFWLTEMYFPAIHEMDTGIFPSLSEIRSAFPSVRFYPVPIPANCLDGFTAAYWARPEAYLEPKVRASMSTFSKIKDVAAGVNKLKQDLATNVWERDYGHLRGLKYLDVGYTLAVWDVE